MGNDAEVKSVLADWRTGAISPRLRAALAFLEKLTLSPEEVAQADAAAARAAGISHAALREVIYVCFLFSTMDRLADALDFPLLDARAFKRGGWMIGRFGYRALSV